MTSVQQEEIMISKKLVDLIHDNISRLASQWTKQIKESEHTRTYQRFSDDELQRRNKRFFENLVKWLAEGAHHDEIKSYFARIGRERYHEGIPLDEINFGIITAKKLLCNLILSEAVFLNAVAIYQALEIMTVMYNYFDFGYFYIGREYLEAMYAKMQSTQKFADRELKNYIFPGAVITGKDLEAMFGMRFRTK